LSHELNCEVCEEDADRAVGDIDEQLVVPRGAPQTLVEILRVDLEKGRLRSQVGWQKLSGSFDNVTACHSVALSQCEL